MIKQNQISDNILWYNEDIASLIKRKPQIPLCQRQFIDERVNEIYQKIENFYSLNKDKEYKIPYLGFIHCALLNNKILYILDGQHRYRAYERFYKTIGISFKVNYIIKLCHTEQELREFFKDLNNNYNPQDIILNDKDLDVASIIKKHIKDKYSEHISSSANPRLSNINLDQVCKYFINLCPDLIDPLEIVQKFEQLNSSLEDEYSTNKSEKIKKVIEDSQQKQNLYVSLLFQKETEAKKRTQIPAAVRKKLWSQEIGLDNMTGLCNLCESQITYTNYHAGHIISSCNGGTDNISNLKILCPLCNLSMSSTNLEEFRERYF